MAVEVRFAQPADDAECEEVDRLALADLRAVYRPTAAAERQKAALTGGQRHLVAIVDGRIVGVVRCYTRGDSLAVFGLGVHPAYRRLGIARALLERLERLAIETGTPALTLYTIRQAENAPIFQSLGFSVVSEEPATLFEAVNGGELTEVFMRKTLQPS